MFASAIALCLMCIYVFFVNIFDLRGTNDISDIKIVNISSNSVDIYWKTKSSNLPILEYKEKNDTGLYKELSDVDVYMSSNDILVNHFSLNNLEKDKEYVFNVKYSGEYIEKDLSFKTEVLNLDLNLPDVAEEKYTPGSLILAKTENGKEYMYVADINGYVVFDKNSLGEVYTLSKYADNKYLERAEEYKSLISKVYASGTNCNENTSDYGITSVSSYKDLIDSRLKTNSGAVEPQYSECFNDVVCRASNAGVNPRFALAVWMNESNASDYGMSSSTKKDFGVVCCGVGAQDFNGQITQFLSFAHDPYTTCPSQCPKGSCSKQQYYAAWGSNYLMGDCNHLSEGLAYVQNSVLFYYLLAGNQTYSTSKLSELPMPIKDTSNKSSYNCGSSSGSSGSTTTGGDGSKDYMIISGKDRTCKDKDGCICLYGYEDSKADHTLNAGYGLVCPAKYTGKTGSSTNTNTDTNNNTNTNTDTNNSNSGTTSNSTTPSLQSILSLFDGEDTEGLMCCGLKLKNSSKFKYDFENDREDETCNEIWEVGRSVYGSTIEYSIYIPTAKTEKACLKTSTAGVCCLTDDGAIWTPKSVCTNQLKDTTLAQCQAIGVYESSKVSLKEGVNFIGLNINPMSNGSKLKASDLYTLYPESGITLIAKFSNGKWVNILKSDKGEDFELEGNYGYLIITNKSSDITLKGPKSSSSDLKWNNFLGWNLYDTSVFTQSNASSIITGFSNAKVNTVAYWDYSQSKFEYYTRDNTQSGVYGNDFKISDKDSIFVRIYK